MSTKCIRNILILEDDKLFGDTLCEYLSSYFNVDVAKDGEDALEKIYENYYDLFLFDINVPKLNGIDLLKDLRNSDIEIPCIFITSYKNEDKIKEAFTSGCDDYIQKPFNLDELMLRINAILKRANGYKESVALGNNYSYKYDEMLIYLNHIPFPQPLKIIKLLELFLKNNDKVVTKEKITEHLWTCNEEVSSAALRLYISNLRKIVGKDSIMNIKKIGYKIAIHE